MKGYGLTVALPKGRLLAEALATLREAGLDLPAPDDDRAMFFEKGDLALLLLRNADVPTYVDLGIADLGVVGKDNLVEAGRELYEPVDLGFGACRVSLIRRPGDQGPIRRLASKYPRIAELWLEQKGLSADVIKLHGNVELAALVGLADAVVDVVETGTTLKKAGLEEREVILKSSARLVVNKTALKLKAERIRPLIERLRQGGRSSTR